MGGSPWADCRELGGGPFQLTPKVRYREDLARPINLTFRFPIRQIDKVRAIDDLKHPPLIVTVSSLLL